jgi:hypothetical protein
MNFGKVNNLINDMTEPDKGIRIHDTCTSTPLDGTSGSRPEKINAEILEKLHVQKTGTDLSNDPIVARIQREQALVWHKRGKK